MSYLNHTNDMKLLKERDALKSEVNAKSGEIAIVRSKNDQIVKEAQRKEEALNKLHADKEAKWKREIESTRIAEKNAATERDFVKQDLAEEAERVRRLKRAQEAEKKGASVTTPKKRSRFHIETGLMMTKSRFSRPRRSLPQDFRDDSRDHPVSQAPNGNARLWKVQLVL